MDGIVAKLPKVLATAWKLSKDILTGLVESLTRYKLASVSVGTAGTDTDLKWSGELDATDSA